MAGPASALRPYQASVIDRAVELYGQGTRRLLVPLATGLGKTVVFTHLPQVCLNEDVSKTVVINEGRACRPFRYRPTAVVDFSPSRSRVGSSFA